MGGIEEILKQIQREAEQEISEIMSAAETECKKIASDNKREMDAVIASKKTESASAADLALEKMKSGAFVKKKQDILRLKQKLIAETIEKAHKHIVELPTDEYFDILIKIAKNNAHEEDGVIGLNEPDLRRVPADFADKLAQEGLRLTICEQPYDIEDGMILNYGDIEENCTIQALINAKKELLQDKINNYIFG